MNHASLMESLCTMQDKKITKADAPAVHALCKAAEEKIAEQWQIIAAQQDTLAEVGNKLDDRIIDKAIHLQIIGGDGKPRLFRFSRYKNRCYAVAIKTYHDGMDNPPCVTDLYLSGEAFAAMAQGFKQMIEDDGE